MSAKEDRKEDRIADDGLRAALARLRRHAPAAGGTGGVPTPMAGAAPPGPPPARRSLSLEDIDLIYSIASGQPQGRAGS